jgi:hypothetical protein
VNRMRKKYYCGAWWMPEWLQRILSYKFNASCRVHDMDYEAKSKFSKLEADARFMCHMLRQAAGSFFWEHIAWVYYRTARLLGGPSWERGHSEAHSH